jgi:hypothetical protein
MLEHEQHHEDIPSLHTGAIKQGDRVVIRSKIQKNTQSMLYFDIKRTDWSNLGAPYESLGPENKLTGSLHGKEFAKRDAVFLGSGHSLDEAKKNTFTLGEKLFFDFDDGANNLYPTGYNTFYPIDSISIVRTRPDEPTKIFGPSTVQSSFPEISQQHNFKISLVNKIMKSFNLAQDIRQPFVKERSFIPAFLSNQNSKTYNDENYSANFNCNPFNGNQLFIVDKSSKKWLHAVYNDFTNGGFLSISSAELSNTPYLIMPLMKNPLSVPGVLASGSAITTFVSSEKLGMEAINFVPDIHLSSRLVNNKEQEVIFPRPDIQIFPENRINIALPDSLDNVIKKHPDIISRISNDVRAGNDVYQSGELHIKEEQVIVPNPIQDFVNLLNIIQAKK